MLLNDANDIEWQREHFFVRGFFCGGTKCVGAKSNLQSLGSSLARARGTCPASTLTLYPPFLLCFLCLSTATMCHPLHSSSMTYQCSARSPRAQPCRGPGPLRPRGGGAATAAKKFSAPICRECSLGFTQSFAVPDKKKTNGTSEREETHHQVAQWKAGPCSCCEDGELCCSVCWCGPTTAAQLYSRLVRRNTCRLVASILWTTFVVSTTAYTIRDSITLHGISSVAYVLCSETATL